MGVTTVIKDYGTDILNAIRENNLERLVAIFSKYLKTDRKIAKLCVADIKHRPTKKFACPLILAARQEDSRIMKYMMERGVDPNFIHHTVFSSKRREIVTALHIAVDLGFYKTVEILLDANADSNIGDHSQETPLHIAVKKADRSMTRLLVSKGADPNVPDRRGNAALHICTLYGHLELVRTLLKYNADIYQNGQHGTIPPHIAAKEGHIHLIQLFFASDVGNINLKIPCYEDKREKALLHLAAENGHVETVLALLDQFDAEVNLKDSDGHTPLHCVVLNSYDVHLMRDKDYFNECARVLIKFGVSINEKNMFGDTALHLAATNRFQRIVELLLEVGANPLSENGKGQKPVDMVPDSDPVTKQLLKNAMLRPRPSITDSMSTLQGHTLGHHHMKHSLPMDDLHGNGGMLNRSRMSFASSVSIGSSVFDDSTRASQRFILPAQRRKKPKGGSVASALDDNESRISDVTEEGAMYNEIQENSSPRQALYTGVNKESKHAAKQHTMKQSVQTAVHTRVTQNRYEDDQGSLSSRESKESRDSNTQEAATLTMEEKKRMVNKKLQAGSSNEEMGTQTRQQQQHHAGTNTKRQRPRSIATQSDIDVVIPPAAPRHTSEPEPPSYENLANLEQQRQQKRQQQQQRQQASDSHPPPVSRPVQRTASTGSRTVELHPLNNNVEDQGVEMRSVPGKPGTVELQYAGGPIMISVDAQGNIQYTLQPQGGQEQQYDNDQYQAHQSETGTGQGHYVADDNKQTPDNSGVFNLDNTGSSHGMTPGDMIQTEDVRKLIQEKVIEYTGRESPGMIIEVPQTGRRKGEGIILQPAKKSTTVLQKPKPASHVTEQYEHIETEEYQEREQDSDEPTLSDEYRPIQRQDTIIRKVPQKTAPEYESKSKPHPKKSTAVDQQYQDSDDEVQKAGQVNIVQQIQREIKERPMTPPKPKLLPHSEMQRPQTPPKPKGLQQREPAPITGSPKPTAAHRPEPFRPMPAPRKTQQPVAPSGGQMEDFPEDDDGEASPDVSPNSSPQYKNFSQLLAMTKSRDSPQKQTEEMPTRQPGQGMVATPEASHWKVKPGASAIVESRSGQRQSYAQMTRIGDLRRPNIGGVPVKQTSKRVSAYSTSELALSHSDPNLADQADFDSDEEVEQITQSPVFKQASQHPQKSHKEYYSITPDIDLQESNGSDGQGHGGQQTKNGVSQEAVGVRDPAMLYEEEPGLARHARRKQAQSPSSPTGRSRSPSANEDYIPLHVSGEVPKAYTRNAKAAARKDFMNAAPVRIESGSEMSDNELSLSIGSFGSLSSLGKSAPRSPHRAKFEEPVKPVYSATTPTAPSNTQPRLSVADDGEHPKQLTGPAPKPYKSFGTIETKTDLLLVGNKEGRARTGSTSTSSSQGDLFSQGGQGKRYSEAQIHAVVRYDDEPVKYPPVQAPAKMPKIVPTSKNATTFETQKSENVLAKGKATMIQSTGIQDGSVPTGDQAGSASATQGPTQLDLQLELPHKRSSMKSPSQYGSDHQKSPRSPKSVSIREENTESGTVTITTTVHTTHTQQAHFMSADIVETGIEGDDDDEEEVKQEIVEQQPEVMEKYDSEPGRSRSKKIIGVPTPFFAQVEKQSHVVEKYDSETKMIGIATPLVTQEMIEKQPKVVEKYDSEPGGSKKIIGIATPLVTQEMVEKRPEVMEKYDSEPGGYKSKKIIGVPTPLAGLVAAPSQDVGQSGMEGEREYRGSEAQQLQEQVSETVEKYDTEPGMIKPKKVRGVPTPLAGVVPKLPSQIKKEQEESCKGKPDLVADIGQVYSGGGSNADVVMDAEVAEISATAEEKKKKKKQKAASATLR